MKRPVVGISLGCPCGVGVEVTKKALNHAKVRRALEPVLFGDAADARHFRGLHFRVVSELAARDRRPGRPTTASGLAQHAYVTALVAAAQAHEVDALCTAPVSKGVIRKAGIDFKGHTELLGDAFGRDVLMLMDGPRVRVALATNHLPLAQVPRALTTADLLMKLRLLSTSLARVLRRPPKLAVCGLNPHAGEGGMLGTEEVRVIGPAIARARAEGLDVHGPFAADGLFSHAHRRFGYDAALAMFHDQGLVAAKALDFEATVNVTLGLPLARTSPDHGTAYALAGKGTADARPMINALLKAAKFANLRHR